MRSYYKILHTAGRTRWGDRERRILAESEWMEAQGHQVVIVAPLKSPLFIKARAKGITVYPLSFQTLAQVGEYGRLKQIMEIEQPYVVNAHGRNDARIALKAAKKTGVACRIITRHTGKGLKNTWTNRKLYNKLPHYVFTTAGDTTRHLQAVLGLGEMDVFSIPDAIAPPRDLDPKDEARKRLAGSLSLDPGTRFLGILNRPGQGQIQPLARMLRTLNGPALPHHLIICPPMDETEKKGLEIMARDMDMEDRIHFCPPGENEEDAPWTVYRALDCAILTPARRPFHGLPLEMVQAMYGSCPVIGPDSTGIRDLLIQGKTGLIYDASSPDDFGRLVRQTLDQEASTRERIYTARKRVEKYHTMETMGRDIIRIYRLHQVKIERRFHPVHTG